MQCMQHFCFHFLEGVRATFTVRWFLQRNVVRFSTAVCGEQHCVKTERTAVKQTMPMQIGDNVTCPWETCGDAKYTFKIHSTTNGRPIQYHHLTYLQSSLTISLWWRVGCDGKEESEADRWPSFSLHPSHHPLLPPCVTCEDYWEQVSIITQIYYEVHFFWAQYLQVYLDLG